MIELKSKLPIFLISFLNYILQRRSRLGLQTTAFEVSLDDG